MTAQEQLTMLKADLDLLTTTAEREDYLSQLLGVAAERIRNEGIRLTDSVSDGQLAVMYAAWLYRKRNAGEGMPRMIRYALNNRAIQERGREDDES